MKVICFDTETTGVPARDHRIVEIAVADFESGEVLLHTLINPERPIPAEATAIHKITDEMVKNSPKFRDVAVRVHELVTSADVIVGYNPYYDRDMIKTEFEVLGDLLTPPRWPLFVDGKRIWDLYEPKEKRNLTNAYKRFCDDQGFEGAHGALADTLATIKVIKAQRKTFDLENTDWDKLDPEMKEWWGPSSHILLRDEQLIVNFGKHEKKRAVDVEYGYWNWLAGNDFPDHVVLLSIKIREMHDRRLPVEAVHSWARGYFR